MQQPTNRTVTRWLNAWRNGDPQAPDMFLPWIYPELHHRAKGFFYRERPDHTLQPTALVHEAYQKMANQNRTEWRDRNHFVSVASVVMRRLLCDHARRRRAAKRGGNQEHLAIDDVPGLAAPEGARGERIRLALASLKETAPRPYRVVQLKCFVGLTLSKTAEVLKISRNTAASDWKKAKYFLRTELQEGDRDDTP